MDEESCRYVEGVRLEKFHRQDLIRSAMKYKPRKGDIITVTYPKCGTHWIAVIIWNIITSAKRTPDIAEFSLMCPMIDLVGAGVAENQARMGPIMTHLPMCVLQPVEHAKYIYVARNPYDCAVSFYNFCKRFTPKTVADVSFERFISLFSNGKVMYGDFFDHLLPWYERRHDSNVLFITYEQLKSDIRKEVLRIADFLGEHHGASLREDQRLLNRIIDACSVESMKALFNVEPKERRKKAAALALQMSVPYPTKECKQDENVEMHGGSGFVRTGIVGDWKNYFTPDLLAQTKVWIEKKTKHTDVMNLWEGYGLP